MKKGLYLILSTRTFVRVYLVFLVLIFSVVALTTQKAIKTNATVSSVKPVIIIDAGHGGEDGGTQSADGVLEKDINLAISQKIKKILTRYGFDTVMIRDSDRMIYDEDSYSPKQKIFRFAQQNECYEGSSRKCIFKYSSESFFRKQIHRSTGILLQKSDGQC